jgi:hypothetical protein
VSTDLVGKVLFQGAAAHAGAIFAERKTSGNLAMR